MLPGTNLGEFISPYNLPDLKYSLKVNENYHP